MSRCACSHAHGIWRDSLVIAIIGNPIRSQGSHLNTQRV
jgi:hypothetical protein